MKMIIKKLKKIKKIKKIIIMVMVLKKERMEFMDIKWMIILMMKKNIKVQLILIHYKTK